MEKTTEFDIQLNKALRAASMMRSKGRDLEYIYNELNHEGFTTEIVNRVMHALTDVSKKPAKKEGNFQMILGAIILLFAIVISIISFVLLSGSGRFIVATGAMVSGIVMLIRGFMKRS